MKTATMLILMFVALGAASQDVVPSPAHGQCRFSDGTSIEVSGIHFLVERQQFRLSTNGPLSTTRGISVPAGHYDAYFEKDSHQHWTLKMAKPIGRKGTSLRMFVLSFPMSVISNAETSESPGISFDQTDGSCMMLWNLKKLDTVLSLEFTQKNADIPVLQ